MKTHLLISVLFMSLFLKTYSQDTSKVRVIFKTRANQTIPLYKEIYLGDIETEGYDGEHFVSQQGILTRDDFFMNAPDTAYLERNKPIVLVMKDNYYTNKIKFNINPGFENQKWLLTPPGTDYQKGRRLIPCGIGGLLFSSILFTVVALNNNYKMQTYRMDLNYYNNVKQLGGIFDPGEPPRKPKNLGLKYILPAFTFGLSIHAVIKGSHLYRKNKPLIERIE
ncbi:MAG TPA: hypothetical protein VIH57_21395 [Bacteroidales bacterium]